MTRFGRSLPVRLAVAGASVLLLAACGATSDPQQDRLGKFLVAPGKYRLYDCVQINQMIVGFDARERELRDVKAKAEAGPGGAFVSVLAYSAEYGRVRGNLEDLRREAAEKKCEPPRTPAPAPAPAAPGRGRPAAR